MKLSIIVATLLLLGESNAAAPKETSTRRMRSVKLYSSAPQHDIVDPFIGLPDESGQRGLEVHSMPLSMPLTALEMSMPTASLTDQSFSYSLEESAPPRENEVLPVVAAAESAYNSATVMGRTSAVIAATTVSVISGIVALM
ncbi:hypothetical protein ACHAWT_001768 [Skeletonema menzelii]|eukprot:scaffold6077_cov75-Skeletonema_menzelii.AAC.4